MQIKSKSNAPCVQPAPIGADPLGDFMKQLPGKAAVMKTIQTAILEIATKHPLRCRIEFETLEGLSEAVNELLCELSNSETHDYATITLPSGKICQWKSVPAHYCFDKGRISITDFVNDVFIEEVKL